MPSNDIIDNRDQKLADHINCILGSTEAAKFAVGYFFLSGLEAVAGKCCGSVSRKSTIRSVKMRLSSIPTSGSTRMPCLRFMIICSEAFV
jgi:hypothetical protein